MPANALSRLKRVVRVATKPGLPPTTRRDLLRAERRAGRRDSTVEEPISVQAGPVLVFVRTYKDYVTLYGMLVDQHFKLDLATAAVLDVGAHCGYYAAQAFLRGASAVTSFEPEATNYSMLQLAHRSSSNAHWWIEDCAIGAADGEADLLVSSESWSHSMRHLGPKRDPVAVQKVTVRAFASLVGECLARAPGNPVAVKLNVEGMAGEIIVGSAQSVWASVDELWFDHEPSDPIALDTLDAHLYSSGLVRSGDSGRRHHYTRRHPNSD